MNTRNYTRTIVIDNTPQAAYAALTSGIEQWWTKPDAPLLNEGDVAKFTFPPGKSYWTFKALHLVPDERVEMVCVDALHLHEGQPREIEKEWLGTRVTWDIRSEGSSTTITIEHHGLVPTLHCYDVCEAGWDFFFTESLSQYLNTGKGKPHSYS